MPQYNLAFDPILLSGHTARLYIDASNSVDVRVVAVGPLANHAHDFGTLTGNLLGQDDVHLDLPDGELAQYRFVARGNFDIHLQHPVGVDQYRTNASDKGTRSAAWRIPPWSRDPQLPELLQASFWRLSEFFVLEDRTPRFDLYPYAPTGQGVEAYVDFFGWKFALEKLPAGEQGQTTIWVSGWPASKDLI